MRRFVSLLALPLALAACVDGRDVAGANASNTAEPHISIRNPHHEQLLALNPMLQRLALMRAVRQTGNRCRRVDNSGYQTEYRNMRLWIAECAPDREGGEVRTWQVFIAANGDVQVRNCADAGQLELPRCEPLPPPVPIPEYNGPEVNIHEPIPGSRR